MMHYQFLREAIVMKKILGLVVTVAVVSVTMAVPFFGQQAQKVADVEKDAKYALMSFIPAGDFLMGRQDNKYDLLNKFPRDKDDDRPVHKVFVDGFYLDKFEVTNLEYYRFAATAGRAKPWHWVNGEFAQGAAGKPVYNVTWFDAIEYCKWMGKRLPTEAEWERAARGGLEQKFYPNGGGAYWKQPRGGFMADDDADDAAASGDEAENQQKVDNAFDKFKGNPLVTYDVYRSKEKILKPDAIFDVAFGPEVVGTLKPNGFGLYDIVGNVWEWVNDWFGLAYYSESPSANPKGPETGIDRVMRGGSWVDDSEYVTVWFRNHALPNTKSPAVGFRCACDAPAGMKTKTTAP